MTEPNVYVDEVYDHTRPYKEICMLSMYTYMEYVVILIIYTIVMTFEKKITL